MVALSMQSLEHFAVNYCESETIAQSSKSQDSYGRTEEMICLRDIKVILAWPLRCQVHRENYETDGRRGGGGAV